VPAYQRYAQYNQATNYNQPLNDQELLEQVRNKIVSRGARGINGIKRVFKIMDDNDSKTLDFNEFQKALNDFRIAVPPEDYQRLFGLFDSDRSGEINYDEFLRAIVVSFLSHLCRVI
jgi:Ca2+-binding EF-hand superfamily protein